MPSSTDLSLLKHIAYAFPVTLSIWTSQRGRQKEEVEEKVEPLPKAAAEDEPRSDDG